MSKITDLHMHTIASSDGDFTPQEIINQASEKGLKLISIADHNTTQSVDEAIQLGEKAGVTVIPAIELDCIYKGVNLHILGYGIDPKNEKIVKNSQLVLQMEQENSKKLINKVLDLNICFDTDKVYSLSKNNVVIGETIAEVALEDSRNDNHPLLEPYRKGNYRSENPYVNFYWDICSQGKPAYVHMDFISLETAIKYIQDAHGIAVFAHPAKNIGMDKVLAIDIFNQGLSGFEAYSSYHSNAETEFYLSLAKELNTVVTVGSDYHGKTKPAIKLGMVEVINEEELVNEFLQKLIKKRSMTFFYISK